MNWKKIGLGVLAGFAVLGAISMFDAADPKDVVKEAFEQHDAKRIVTKYQRASDKDQAKYHQLYSEYLLRDFETAVQMDLANKFNDEGVKRWEQLNEMTELAATNNDKRFDADKKLTTEIANCYRMRKMYKQGWDDLYKKYGVNENKKIQRIYRYVCNELTNEQGVFYACGYESVLGTAIPKDTEDECVLDFRKFGYEGLRRGVGNFLVVQDGQMSLEMKGGFKRTVDKFNVLPKEALYKRNELYNVIGQTETHFKNIIPKAREFYAQ